MFRRSATGRVENDPRSVSGLIVLLDNIPPDREGQPRHIRGARFNSAAVFGWVRAYDFDFNNL